MKIVKWMLFVCLDTISTYIVYSAVTFRTGYIWLHSKEMTTHFVVFILELVCCNTFELWWLFLNKALKPKWESHCTQVCNQSTIIQKCTCTLMEFTGQIHSMATQYYQRRKFTWIRYRIEYKRTPQTKYRTWSAVYLMLDKTLQQLSLMSGERWWLKQPFLFCSDPFVTM